MFDKERQNVARAPPPTCVLPPELSCTAVLDSAVLAANDLKVAPNMLLTPNAMSSCDEINHRLSKSYLGLVTV